MVALDQAAPTEPAELAAVAMVQGIPVVRLLTALLIPAVAVAGLLEETMPAFPEAAALAS